jgi:hypothetical protein
MKEKRFVSLTPRTIVVKLFSSFSTQQNELERLFVEGIFILV